MAKFISQLLYILVISILIINPVRPEDDQEAETQDETQINKQKGLELAYQSLNTLIFGEPKEDSYKDLFIDTSKDIFSQVSRANDMISVDDLLRIFIQSIILLNGSRRPDIIPKDFNTRHKVYGQAIQEVNKILELLDKKGTNGVRMRDLRTLIKCFQSDEFWASVYKMKLEVDELVKKEELEEMKKKQNSIDNKTDL